MDGTTLSAEFTDPRLVAIYESVNQYDADAQPRFCAQLVAELRATSIVDLGCGTGLITRELARLGYDVTGVDPSPAMLDVARRRPHGERVHWIRGDGSGLPAARADTAIMTGHVAQFFLSDESWNANLAVLHAALRPGGRLAFESRNPSAREWESWTSAIRRSAIDPEAGPIESWSEFHPECDEPEFDEPEFDEDVRDEVVAYTNHYVFAATGEELVASGKLRFRTYAELAGSLADAGFAVERVYGDWDYGPVAPTAPELIVVASC